MQSFTERSEHRNDIIILSDTIIIYCYSTHIFYEAHSFTECLVSIARRVIYAQKRRKKLLFHVDFTDDNLRVRALALQDNEL